MAHIRIMFIEDFIPYTLKPCSRSERGVVPAAKPRKVLSVNPAPSYLHRMNALNWVALKEPGLSCHHKETL